MNLNGNQRQQQQQQQHSYEANAWGASPYLYQSQAPTLPQAQARGHHHQHANNEYEQHQEWNYQQMQQLLPRQQQHQQQQQPYDFPSVPQPSPQHHHHHPLESHQNSYIWASTPSSNVPVLVPPPPAHPPPPASVAAAAAATTGGGEGHWNHNHGNNDWPLHVHQPQQQQFSPPPPPFPPNNSAVQNYQASQQHQQQQLGVGSSLPTTLPPLLQRRAPLPLGSFPGIAALQAPTPPPPPPPLPPGPVPQIDKQLQHDSAAPIMQKSSAEVNAGPITSNSTGCQSKAGGGHSGDQKKRKRQKRRNNRPDNNNNNNNNNTLLEVEKAETDSLYSPELTAATAKNRGIQGQGQSQVQGQAASNKEGKTTRKRQARKKYKVINGIRISSTPIDPKKQRNTSQRQSSQKNHSITHYGPAAATTATKTNGRNNNGRKNAPQATKPAKAAVATTRKLIGSTLSAPGYDSMDCSEDDDEDDANAESDNNLDTTIAVLSPLISGNITPLGGVSKSSQHKELLLQVKERLRRAQLKREELFGDGGGDDDLDPAAVACVSVITSDAARKEKTKALKKQLQAMKLRHAAAAASSSNDKDLDLSEAADVPIPSDAARKEKTIALKKQLQAMKVRHAAAEAAQQRHHSQQHQQHQRLRGVALPPLTALQEGNLDSLIISNIDSSGPRDQVRFPTVFVPPLWGNTFLHDQGEQNRNSGPEDPTTAQQATETSAAQGQFDDADDDEAGADPVPTSQQAPLAENPFPDTVSNYLPKLFPPGEEAMDQHLKSIAVLKRKMELKRKTIELKEKLLRLGNAKSGQRKNAYQNSAGRQKVSWVRSEEEEQEPVLEEADLEILAIPLSLANLSKEELELRRSLAQQTMDVSQMQHFVSKQTYMLLEQQKEVSSNSEKTQQCKDMIIQKRKELQDEDAILDDLQIRKLAVTELMEQQILLLLAKRNALRRSKQEKSSSTEVEDEIFDEAELGNNEDGGVDSAKRSEGGKLVRMEE